MTTTPELSPILLWQEDGHLTELAITALADDQRQLLPESALEHLLACERCSERAGQAALLSLEMGRQLSALNEADPTWALSHAAPSRAAPSRTAPSRALAVPAQNRAARRPLPKLAIAAALFLAAVGAVPGTVALAESSGSWIVEFFRGIPLVLTAAVRLWRSLATHGAVAMTVLSAVTAIVLLAVGAFIARRQPRRLAAKGDS